MGKYDGFPQAWWAFLPRKDSEGSIRKYEVATLTPDCHLQAGHILDCDFSFCHCFQGELHVSKLFSHPNIVPYRATFIADNELWVVTSFMAYGECADSQGCRWVLCCCSLLLFLTSFSGSAKDLIGTHFMDGMSELAIAYILQGVLKALDYIHHMGYVHRCVPSRLTLNSQARVHNQGSGF